MSYIYSIYYIFSLCNRHMYGCSSIEYQRNFMNVKSKTYKQNNKSYKYFLQKSEKPFLLVFPGQIVWVLFLKLRDFGISTRVWKLRENKRYSNTEGLVLVVVRLWATPLLSTFAIRLKTILFFMVLILILIPFVAISKLVRKIRSLRPEG